MRTMNTQNGNLTRVKIDRLIGNTSLIDLINGGRRGSERILCVLRVCGQIASTSFPYFSSLPPPSPLLPLPPLVSVFNQRFFRWTDERTDGRYTRVVLTFFFPDDNRKVWTSVDSRERVRRFFFFPSSCRSLFFSLSLALPLPPFPSQTPMRLTLPDVPTEIPAFKCPVSIVHGIRETGLDWVRLSGDLKGPKGSLNERIDCFYLKRDTYVFIIKSRKHRRVTATIHVNKHHLQQTVQLVRLNTTKRSIIEINTRNTFIRALTA